MPYDYDVLVIGGGPAGLAAATRARWVKGYHVLVSSVCIVEPGELGGLLSWGSCVMTGPGWAYSGTELTTQLLDDVERFQIPTYKDTVVGLSRSGSIITCHLRSGQTIRCLSVIIATGFRPVGNESQYYLKGVRITFKGYDHFPSLIRSCAKDAQGRGLVVVGNQKTEHLRELLDANTDGAGDVTVLDTEALVSILGNEHVRAVTVRTTSGTTKTIDCGAVLMDYNAMELSPQLSLSGLPLSRDERGFILVDAHLRTNQAGIYAAGDITGRYAATLMALGDGVCAGFGAYVHAFKTKFGAEPNLFAYAATDKPLPLSPKDIPPIPEDAIPVALGDAPEWIDGVRTIEEHCQHMQTTTDQLLPKLMALVLEKNITFHRIGVQQ